MDLIRQRERQQQALEKHMIRHQSLSGMRYHELLRTFAPKTNASVAQNSLSSSSSSSRSAAPDEDDEDWFAHEGALDTGVHESDPPRSLSLLQRLTLKPSPVTIPPNCISLHYLHAFLSEEECAHLIELSHGQFSRPLTYGGVSAGRTSDAASPSERDPVVLAVRTRVTELTGAPDSRIEELNVVRYKVAQQYRPHFDSSLVGHRREFTLFVYLNTLPAGAGGETEFTRLRVKFAPKAGDALFWRNHKDRYSPHFLDGEHAGRPPLSGVKYGQSASGWTAIHSSQGCCSGQLLTLLELVLPCASQA
jgi:hypothetical protein